MRLHLLRCLPQLHRVILGGVVGAGLALAVALMGTPAFAADAETVVNFGPLAAVLISYFAPTILSAGGVLGMWVLYKLASFLGLKIDDRRRAALEQGLERAIGFAVTRLENRAIGGIPIAIKSRAIIVAADYAQKSIPGALKHFGKSPEDLAEMIESRLEGVLIDPSVEVADPHPDARRVRTATPAYSA